MIQANTPWSGAYIIEKTLWAVAHTTQFVKPGWKYVKDANFRLPAGGSLITYTDPEHEEITIVIETTGASKAQELRIELLDLPQVGLLHLWETDDLRNFFKAENLTSNNDQFSLVLKPR